MNVFHFTNKAGWNAIRSQEAWRFAASQPLARDRPFGVYFTTILPTQQSLRTLHKRLRVPKIKQEYVFCFEGDDHLKRLNGGRGRDQWILFSPSDYEVEKSRQCSEGLTREVVEDYS